jgi:hypothetical protein
MGLGNTKILTDYAQKSPRALHWLCYPYVVACTMPEGMDHKLCWVAELGGIHAFKVKLKYKDTKNHGRKVGRESFLYLVHIKLDHCSNKLTYICMVNHAGITLLT